MEQVGAGVVVTTALAFPRHIIHASVWLLGSRGQVKCLVLIRISSNCILSFSEVLYASGACLQTLRSVGCRS